MGQTEADSGNAAGNSHAVITHGPILGRPGPDSMGVWVRTSEPGDFLVTCKAETAEFGIAEPGTTSLHHDNTGCVIVRNLKPDTRYSYSVKIPGYAETEIFGSFSTLPAENQVRNEQHNPEGLFNFSFEFGCGNYQTPRIYPDTLMPTYATMQRRIADKVQFQVMNGDFIYEAARGTSPSEWGSANNVSKGDLPDILDMTPGLAGVWANYKLYLDRSQHLREWHRTVPALFVIDDHEILNDIGGTGRPGHRNKVALFRDVGVRAWRDYVGWSNPYPPENRGEIFISRGSVNEGEPVLTDTGADYSGLSLDRISNLHIHWNGDHPAAGVYEVERTLDSHRLRIYPAPPASGRNIVYSLGKLNYYSFRVSNCEFFVLDTRSMRGLHNVDNPWKQGLSMLGERQYEWLVQGMQNSDADFFFVVSSVNFTIPHVSPRDPEKDEAWTVFLEERERLFDLWDDMERPVFLLTGDLHNSFAIQITDNLWEFASGPHSSGNHYAVEEGDRPPSGPFSYNGRTVDIRWSSYFLDDVPRRYLRKKYYCVVQVNNVLNNPTEERNPRWVAYPEPQVMFRFYDGESGELEYTESVTGG